MLDRLFFSNEEHGKVIQKCVLLYVAFCTGFNLLTPIFMLPYIIMDLPIFQMSPFDKNDRLSSIIIGSYTPEQFALIPEHNNFCCIRGIE